MSLSISVIIPTYNRAHLVGRAIQSALSQCEPGDEVIVIDDGSTDGTREVVAPFGSRVRYQHVTNGGCGRARNIGLSVARGDLVAFLDSDDEWFPGKLMLQRRLMRARPEVLFSFSNFAVTFADGSIERNYLEHWLTGSPTWDQAIGPARPFSGLASLPAGIEDFNVHIGDLSAAEMLDNYLLTSSVVVRRREAGEALRFAEDLRIYEDWYCFARLSLLGQGAYLDRETTWQHGVAETRVSNVDWLIRCECWQALEDRLWSREENFRLEHEAAYERTLAIQQLTYVRALCAAGRTREAREILGRLHDVPRSYRLLAKLPGSLTRSLAHVRHWMNGWKPGPGAVPTS